MFNVLSPNISTTIPNQCGRIVGDGSILGTAMFMDIQISVLLSYVSMLMG